MKQFMCGSICVLCLAMAMITVPASASGSRLFTMGVKGGANNSGFTSELGDRLDYHLGGAIGIYAQTMLSTRTSLLVEIAYSQKGAGDDEIARDVFTPVGIAFRAKRDYSLNYLTVPFLLTLSFPFSARYAWCLSAGLYGSYLIDASITVDVFNDAGEVVDQQSWDTKSDYKSYDVGAAVGAGFLINLSKIDLSIEARWEIGFINVVEDSDPSGTNSNFSFLVGVGFPLHS